MKFVKTNKIAALTTAGAIAFANLGAITPTFAATSGQTTLTLNVSLVEPSYELWFPGDTTVTGAGWNSIGSGLGIKNLTEGDKVNKIRVDAGSTNDWKFKKNEGDTDGIGYELRTSESGSKVTYIDYSDTTKMAEETGEISTIGVNVDSFSDMPDGDYEDTIKWSTTVDRKISEIKIKQGTSASVAVGNNLELEAEISPAGLSVVYDWTVDDTSKVTLTKVEGSPNKIKVNGVTTGETYVNVTAGGLPKKTCQVTVTSTN